MWRSGNRVKGWWEHKNKVAAVETVWWFLKWLTVASRCDPAVPLLFTPSKMESRLEEVPAHRCSQRHDSWQSEGRSMPRVH